MRNWLLIFLLMGFEGFAQNTFPPIGSWREHLPYQGSIDLTASPNKIYSATPYALFTVDRNNGEIGRLSKVGGLSETGISTIRIDESSSTLYIAYTNSNIDLLTTNGIINIPDLKRENISGDKNIYNLYPSNNLCYLSTGLGLIVLDAVKKEIRDTWFIGNSGGPVKTTGFTIQNGAYYAATEEGLKKLPAGNSNPADFHNWQIVSSAPANDVVSFSGKVISLQNDTLFTENGASWTPFFANGWPVVSINVSENKLLVCQMQASGAAQVLILNPDGSVLRTLQQPGLIAFPKKGILAGGDPWIADLYGGLSHWTGNSFEAFKPNSPVDVALGGLAVYHNKFYATAGSVNEAWNYQYNRGGIYQLSGNSWTNYNQYNFSQLDTVLDFITIVVDPRDETFWAGSYGGGLVHFTPSTLQIYKQSSPLGATIGDPTSYRVSGLAFDSENNLWISNFGAERQLHVLKNDGSWKSFTIPLQLNLNAVSQIVADEANQKWIVSPMSNGLIVFNDNNTIDNTADDRWRMYRAGAGTGNLPSNEVFSIARDKSGFIWVGTADGIAVIQCPLEAFNTGCEAVLPTITEGGFTSYLFKGQEVRSIAVDGADRKWVATSSGAWLVSADGDKVLANFTETNSPLLSNDVKTIAVDGQTGEVFFATAKGISSYRGAATEAEETKDQVLVYPNPVPPSYNGSIGIRGVPENSIVKILEANGRLVYQTRALGGQAIWNGKDYRGRQASSGVYLVMAVNEDRTEKLVAKIVFISK